MDETQGMSPDEIALMAELGTDGNPPEAEGENETGRDEDTATFVNVQSPRAGDPAPTVDDNGQPIVQAAPVVAAEEEQTDEEADDTPEPLPVPSMETYEADRAALRAEKAAIEARWGNGELSDEDRAAEVGAVDDKLDAQLATKVRADVLIERNEHEARRSQQRAISGIKAAGKAIGIDYADDGMVALFNAKLDAVTAADQAKPFSARLKEAHEQVVKLLGKTAAPAPPPGPKKVDRSVDLSKLPPTLSRVPPAADPSVGGNEFAHLDGLSGDAKEKAVAKMTPEELDRWLA